MLLLLLFSIRFFPRKSFCFLLVDYYLPSYFLGGCHTGVYDLFSFVKIKFNFRWLTVISSLFIRPEKFRRVTIQHYYLEKNDNLVSKWLFLVIGILWVSLWTSLVEQFRQRTCHKWRFICDLIKFHSSKKYLWDLRQRRSYQILFEN